MNVFDKYIFDEIVEQYRKESINKEEYEELFQRMCGLEHLLEIKPYLLTMKAFGWGTEGSFNSVVDELKTMDNKDTELNGLYYELLIYEDQSNEVAIHGLKEALSKGYTAQYLKEKSVVSKLIAQEKDDTIDSENDSSTVDNSINSDTSKPPLKFRYITFESCGYNGLYFTSGDIDYLCAKAFFVPCDYDRKLFIRSQVFDSAGEPFSDIFSDEIILHANNTWIRTTGWGNKNCYAYPEGSYKWVIEINKKDTYSQEFFVYNGKLTHNGPRINDVKLFAAKASGSTKEEQNNYSATFDRASLEYIYFKMFIDEPGSDMRVQVFIKVECLEDNTITFNKYFLHKLDYNTYAAWNGVGYNQKGKWKEGLYRYYIRIGKGEEKQGTFTVV